MNKEFLFSAWHRARKWLVTAFVGALLLGTWFDLYQRYQYMFTAPFPMWKPSFFIVSGFYIVVVTLTWIEIWRPEWLAIARRLRARLGWLRWAPVIFTGLLVGWFFIFAPWGEIFSGNYARAFLIIYSIILMSWLATRGSDNSFEWRGVLIAGTLMPGIFSLTYNFQHVVDYPFTLFWSEGNRMWDYSVLYGRRLYDFPAGQPFRAYIDIGRQSLWGMPWLFADISIAQMRLWDALVFCVPSVSLGLYAFRPQAKVNWQWLIMGMWCFIFLNQGPIYSPLVLAAVLVAAGRRKHWLINLLLVGLASYYARNSRMTWVFAPAMWAGMLALFDAPDSSMGRSRFYWLRAIPPVLAGLLGGYFLMDVWPQILGWLRGVPAETSIVSVEGVASAGDRQPLLWDRLWPNPTNPLGIIPSLVLAVLPLIILLLVFSIKRRVRPDFWQAAAMAGSLGAFLVVGLVVSVKIGGGSNLHNVDMFLICLLFIAAIAWDRGGQEWITDYSNHPWWLRIILLAAVLLPLYGDFRVASPLVLPGQEVIEDSLNHIRLSVDEGKKQGEVLFIDQRQLLTFGYVKDVPLVAEYEKKRMMDNAMAENEAYFIPFNKDLAQHRFSLIVSEPVFIRYQGEEYHFGNENDAWVKWVSTPVLCYYEVSKYLEAAGVQLLTPRKQKLQNPNVICPDMQ